MAGLTSGKVSATIAYNGQSYKVYLTGKVTKDGSVSGTARSSTGQALTFTLPARVVRLGVALHSTVQSAQVKGHDATFRFTIPASVPGLAGTKVTVKVRDGGFGARHDTYTAGITGTKLSPYPIIGGPGITVR